MDRTLAKWSSTRLLAALCISLAYPRHELAQPRPTAKVASCDAGTLEASFLAEDCIVDVIYHSGYLPAWSNFKVFY